MKITNYILLSLFPLFTFACGNQIERFLNDHPTSAVTSGDTTAPTQTAVPVAGSTLGSLTQVDITFSEPMKGADVLANYVWSGAGLGSIANTSVVLVSGNTYRLALSGLLINGARLLTLQNMTDIAGNPLTGTTIAYTANTINPTQVAGPASGSPVKTLTSVTVTYSRAVLGAGVVGNYSISNAAGGDLTLSSITGPVGNVYTLNLGGTTVGNGTITITISGITDLALLPLAGNTITYTADTIAPTVALSSTAPSPTNTSPIPVVVTFSEAVTGFTSAGITVGNGTAGAVSGGPAVYNVSITPSAQGVVTVDVAGSVCTDLAGNNNTAATQLSRTFDSVAPTITITSTAPNPTNTSPIPVTFTFSKNVTGFGAAGITVGNGTAGAVTGGPSVYNANITPIGQGVVTVDVAAGVAQDSASNPNSSATQLSRTYDSVPPTITITSTAPNPTNASPIPVTFTFSENVTGFVVGAITVGNGTAGVLSGGPAVYTANITPIGQGAVTIDVAAGAAQDAAGNTSTVATQLSRTYDTVAPTITITSTAPTTTNISPIPVTFTFSENVTGFVVGSITVGNGVAGGFAGGPAVYTANITPTAAGAVTVDVAAGAAKDAALNNSTVATQLSRTYVLPSTPTIISVSPGDGLSGIGTNSASVITFSEAMNVGTITTNTTNTVCSGSLQLSADNFVTCVQMTAAPVASNANQTFTITPLVNMAAVTVYKARVTTAAQNIGGTPLAAAYTSVTGFTTAAGADTQPPTLISTTPANSASGVATNTNIAVTFSEPMNVGTLTVNTTNTSCSGSLQVSSDLFVTCVRMLSAPAASSLNQTFTITPFSNLSASTAYRIRVTTAVSDVAGNLLATQQTTIPGFTTGAGPDVTPPTVTATSPLDGDVSIPQSTAISVTFSEAMNVGTLTTNVGTTACSGSLQVSGDNFVTCEAMSSQPVSANGNTQFTVSPFSAFADTSTFKIRVTSAVTDAAGNALAAIYTQATGFATVVPGSDSPGVSSTDPIDGATAVAKTTAIIVKFNLVMDLATITTNTIDTTCSGSFQVSSDNFVTCVQMAAAPVASVGDTVFSVTPVALLTGSTIFKIRITVAALDVFSNPVTAYTSTTGFTTAP